MSDSDSDSTMARTKQTVRHCTGSMPARKSTDIPPPGVVLGASIRASSTDPVVPEPKSKRVPKPLDPATRERYNAKRRIPAEKRKYTHISYVKANEKTKNDAYYVVSWK